MNTIKVNLFELLFRRTTNNLSDGKTAAKKAAKAADEQIGTQDQPVISDSAAELKKPDDDSKLSGPCGRCG